MLFLFVSFNIWRFAMNTKQFLRKRHSIAAFLFQYQLYGAELDKDKSKSGRGKCAIDTILFGKWAHCVGDDCCVYQIGKLNQLCTRICDNFACERKWRCEGGDDVRLIFLIRSVLKRSGGSFGCTAFTYRA